MLISFGVVIMQNTLILRAIPGLNEIGKVLLGMMILICDGLNLYKNVLIVKVYSTFY